MSLAASSLVHAASRAEGPYTIHHEVADAGGQRAAGGPYTAHFSFNEVAGVAIEKSPLIKARHGYVGQINEGPVLHQTLPDQTSTFGASFSFTLPRDTFLDPDFGETLAYSISGLPPGLSFDPATRQITGTPTAAGSYSVTVTGRDRGAPVLTRSASFSLTVGKAMPELVWSQPTDIVYGIGLSVAQLNAVANVPGTFAYAPPLGTLLNAANAQTLHAQFTPADTANFHPAPASVTLNVLKAPLTVTAHDAARDFGAPDPPFAATISGFVNGDTAAVVSGSPVFSTTATAASLPGTYPITPSLGTLNAANYAFVSFVNGSLTIRNTAPLAHAQSLTLAEDTPTAVTLNGIDPEGLALTFSVVTLPNHGTLSGTPPNLIYLPNPNYYGPDSLTFIVHDGEFPSASATVSFTITSSPDAPTISSLADQTMAENATLSLSFSVGDVDTPVANLSVVTQSSNAALVPNNTSALLVSGAGSSRVLKVTPLNGQSGTTLITLTVADGDLSASANFQLTVTAGGKRSARQSGKVIHGYVAQARIFFDANRNGVPEAHEPSTQSDSHGSFNLEIPIDEFDVNRNGALDAEEGRLVVLGGVDIATGLPLAASMAAPLDAAVITPLTTLLDELRQQNTALTPEQAADLVLAALGLADLSGAIGLTHYDPFDAALLNDPNAALIQAAAAAVYDTLVQAAALLEGASGSSVAPQSSNANSGSQISRKSLIRRMAAPSAPSSTQIAASVIQALAAKALASGRLNLSAPSEIVRIIEQSASALNVALPPASISGAAAIVAEVNQAKDQILASGLTPQQALAQITQVQHVAQADAAVDLKALGTGAVAVDDVVLSQTGGSLVQAIQAAPVGDLTGFDTRPGILSFSRAEFQVREGGAALEAVTLNRDHGTRGEITALVTLQDGAATAASGDYTAGVISVRFADGEISQVVDLSGRIAMDGKLEGDETIRLSLALAAGAPPGAAVGFQSAALLTVIDADSPGAFAFTEASFEVRENGMEPNTVTIARTGGTLGIVTLLLTPEAVAGGASPGIDFVASPIAVTFEAGARFRRVPMPVVRDAETEGNEPFQVKLALAANAPPGAALGVLTTATVTILDVPNTPPTATARQVIVLEDGTLNLTLTGEDKESDPLTFTLLSQPTYGAVANQPPHLSYRPHPNFHGTDSFTFKANDGLADSTPATITITVSPVNDAPVVANPVPDQAGLYGSDFMFAIPADAFRDVDAGQTLSFSATGLPPGITLDAATRTLSGKPTLAGSFSVTLTATDNGTPSLTARDSFEITTAKAPLTVTAHDAARDYGQENPPLTGTLAGVVNQDKITATYSTTAAPNSALGTYPIVPSLFDLEGKLPNYTVTQREGTLTVRNVPPVVEAGPDQEKVAGDEVTFAGSFTDPSSPSHVVGWDFGDGSAPVIGTLTPAHSYSKHGVYAVRLTVTDSHLASASDTLTVTVISSYGCALRAAERLKPFLKDSKRIEKAFKDLTASLEAKFWMDEVHLNPKGGRKAFVLWRQATDLLEQLVNPSKKREDDGEDDDEEEDEEFERAFNSRSAAPSAAALQAAAHALHDLICASLLISETLYLENEGLEALDPRRQKQVDAGLARARQLLDEANALAEKSEFGAAVRRYLRSWNNTLDAIKTARRSQPAKELAKAMELIDQSQDPKYWADETHLKLETGDKAFSLMQAAARELASVIVDAQKGRVIASIGEQAAQELAEVVATGRRVSQTLYGEKQRLVAVNPKHQKAVEAELKRAKEELEKGSSAEASRDWENALNHYAKAWEAVAKAIQQASRAN